ncbi:hypothetical protein GCM10027035_33280 [Emticicia sediminis]
MSTPFMGLSKLSKVPISNLTSLVVLKSNVAEMFSSSIFDFVTGVGFVVSTFGKQLERPDAIKSIEIPM